MLCCWTMQVMNKGLSLLAPQHLAPIDIIRSSSDFRWGLRRGQDAILSLQSRKIRPIRVLANPNVPPGRRSSSKVVNMVDPLEAKRLAAKQMVQIKAKERLKRRREIEAINGAWAMLGLTAGLVIEGQTGHGILSQLAGYWAAFVGLFTR
ncbi:uncharacterized protein LOC113775310 [Coffea eugenioides]|uniref:Uncharacterized protein n=1 Tax=Coffea arabica TaxID=13443 RepID=A0A6P6SW32_COFAR|nr:uncharacterized protein LOC113695220 [Coffea arabica]XP_027175931.1 uncharacterized protein LOC113775310 [Coffea eugenioides]